MSSHPGRELLATYLRPQRARAVLLGAVLVAGLGLQLANPLILESFIDGAARGEALGGLLNLAVGFFAVALAAQVAMVAESYVANDLGWRTTNALRTDLTRRVLDLDDSFHARHNAGQLVERVDGDVTAVAGFFSRFIVYVLGNALFLLGVLVVVFTFDWRIGALLGAFSGVALLVMTGGGGFVGRRSRAARVAVGDLSGFVEERLGGLPDLKANGADGHVLEGLHAVMQRRYDTARAASLSGSAFTAGVSSVFVIGTGASLALSAWLYRRGDMSVGAVFAVLRYTTMLRFPLEALSRQMNSLQQATGGMVRVGELLRIEPVIRDGPGADLGPGPVSVSFDGVTFGYGIGASPSGAVPPTGPTVLQDLSFRLEPGEVMGLVGRTGSGKTTVSRLLFRLYDPVSGVVRLNDIDVRSCRLDELRGRIGLVTQDVHLFWGSVRDNLTMFDDLVPEDRLREVVGALGLDEWLDRLPAGLDTDIGPGGQGMSAGEAQLVALARVFLADPGLVILDEASSRLDPATEHLVEAAVGRLLEGRTGIVIAHRLSTLDRADSVLVLEDGRGVEHGRRADLDADPSSRFSRLRRLGLGVDGADAGGAVGVTEADGAVWVAGVDTAAGLGRGVGA